MGRFNLTADESDVLSDIFYHEGMRPFLKVISQIVEKDFGNKILSANIEDVENLRREYDGAKKLYLRLKAESEKAREK